MVFCGCKILNYPDLLDESGLFRMEEFVALVLGGGKVTVPVQLRGRFNVAEGCYVRLALVEVLRKRENGGWVRRKVEP